MKRIELEDLKAKYRIEEYLSLYHKVIELIDSEKLKPVKASGKNGKKPALYNQYWIIEEEQDYSEYIDELSYRISPFLSTNYYLKHLKQYQEDRVWVLLLNDFFMNKKEVLFVSKSMNERSFEIWHREKFLKEEQGKKILKRCGIELEQLNIYETTQPLSYYVHTRKIPQNMLILENKDTFYSMRKHLLSGENSILGCPIGTLIFGAGKGIFRSFQDFSLCAEPYMKDDNNTIYYFGDLDYEGILIYEGVANLFLEKCKIIPFTTAYVKMIQKAKEIGIDCLPNMKEGQNEHITNLFFSFFHENVCEEMKQILAKGKYIPQEILTIDLF